MKDLQAYTTVRRDVDLDSTPRRNENGTYHWANGQLKILNQEEFRDLRENQMKVQRIDKQIKILSQEMLAFNGPTQALEQEGNGLLQFNQAEIAEEKARLEGLKFKLAQLDKAMLKRGFIPPTDKPEVVTPPTPKAKQRWIRWKEILGFFAIWLVGEIFMTYVQWHSLRDGKGIEDMIVRSLSLGVVLFLIHLVGRYYKKVKKPVYLIFLGFSFLMLIAMLIGPLLLNEAYPPLDGATSIAEQWSLTDEVTEPPTGEATSPYPFWVNFYRNNDMLPGIFVFLFFVIMQTFVKRTIPKVEEPSVPLSPEAGTDEVAERRNYYLHQIKMAEDSIGSLTEAQKKAVAPNTDRLSTILGALQSKQSELEGSKQEKDHLIMSNELLLKRLEMQLNHYQTEFMDILKNDQVKGLVLQPDWPNNRDMRTYFNLS